MERLVLASACPRRAALLTAAGFEFDVVPADITDGLEVEETPDGYVRRLALGAADAATGRAGGRPVLAAATIHVCDGRILGSPATASDAGLALRALSGREHVVTSAICLARFLDDVRQVRTHVERTSVAIASMTEEEIEWYVGTGEGIGEPGGYRIDRLASRFVTSIAGSYANALGLPVAAVYEMCTELQVKTQSAKVKPSLNT